MKFILALLSGAVSIMGIATIIEALESDCTLTEAMTTITQDPVVVAGTALIGSIASGLGYAIGVNDA